MAWSPVTVPAAVIWLTTLCAVVHCVTALQNTLCQSIYCPMVAAVGSTIDKCLSVKNISHKVFDNRMLGKKRVLFCSLYRAIAYIIFMHQWLN